MYRKIQAIILCVLLAPAMLAHAQSQPEQNARALKPYMTTRTISTLEWELLQFNLLWQGTLARSVGYLTSYPIVFDPKGMRFRATFAVQEKREYNDPEPFFTLSRVRRESILQGAVDDLVDLLGQRFAEVNSNPGLMYVEFWFRTSGEGRTVIAKYENGTLSLAE